MADLSNKAEHALQVTTASRKAFFGLAGNPRAFTLWQRVQISFASWIGYLAALLIGRSLRWEVMGWENWKAARRAGKRIIYTFWHHEIFSATWFWRKRGIVVMTSQNFDGEYIARIIQKHGYGAARGSSSRGTTQALREMIRVTRRGLDTALTVDGPRGPRYVAKPGPVMLAKATGAAILCFHISARKTLVLRKSWDHTEIPIPFSPIAIFIAPPIFIDRVADEQEQERKLTEVQTTLDELARRGEEWKKAPKARFQTHS
jgi:lysophospholipid acyltransferase (LPLAT)-like uncharacterized protein